MHTSFRHIAVYFVLCWNSVTVMAQPDALARDFEKLSAKERARIAKEEQVAAQNDADYQAVMGQAEQLFQRSEYEASLEKYQAARTMRPYNVYPKVKIQDLQALIAKRDAQAAAATKEIAPEPVAIEEPDPLPVPVTTEPAKAQESLVIGRTPLSEPPKVLEHPVVKSAPVVTSAPPKPRAAVVQPTLRPEASPPVDGKESERVYKEGRSVVVERKIVEEGRIVVFRKVSHPWGEVNYFRDGIAVSDRVYEQAMVGR